MSIKDFVLYVICYMFTLSCIFHVKHFVADFLLQGKYMIGKFKDGWGWVLPLAAHCGVHLLFTLILTLWLCPRLWWLCIFDFCIHFAMDRIKASPNMLGQFKALSAKEYVGLQVMNPDAQKDYLRSNTFFWWSLGLDQMVHGLTHEVIILIIAIGHLWPMIQ